MHSRATSTDWKTTPLPAETAALPFHKVFSNEAFEQLCMGFIPLEMEDKWFMYYENGQLNIHRSWTGFHIYQVTIAPAENNTYQVTKAVVNRNESEYNQQDADYDCQLLGFLIDRILLGKNIPFPTPGSVTDEQQSIFRHSMVGYATPAAQHAVLPAVLMESRLAACLALGAIGDALGSSYEGKVIVGEVSFDQLHGITDDTQLTLATCEAIVNDGKVTAAGIAKQMLAWYNSGRLTGLGASTLKALRDLQLGAHWALAGRRGEYAAGNGAAMRIAPLAFFVDPENDRELIKDVCNITHKNDEAFVGCLSIVYALHFIIHNKWPLEKSLVELIIPHLPDTGVRDNLIKLKESKPDSITEAARLIGTAGHVIESVPFAIFSAQQIRNRSIENILAEIIHCGGDTDSNASMAGQMIGAYVGVSGFTIQTMHMFNLLKRKI